MNEIPAGLVVHHPYHRTVEQSDNIFATMAALNTAQAHFNLPGALAHLDGTFPERLVVGSAVLAIATGLSYTGWPGVVVDRELGLTGLRFPSATFPGDTLTAQSTVIAAAPDGDGGVLIDSLLEMENDKGGKVLEARRRLRLVPWP